MSVANILDNLVQEQIDPVWVPVGGGGVGTLSQVLTAGNSAGCQLITDVFKVEGCTAAGTDFTLATHPANPNSDLYIANANPTDGVYVEAGTQLHLQTDVTASGANTDIRLSAGNTVITPNIGYPYPAVVETGVAITQYNNPSAGGQQIGLSVDTITTGGQCEGIAVTNIQSTAGDAYGEQISSIGGGGAAYGISVAGVNALTGGSAGVIVSGVSTDPATGGEPVGVFVGGTAHSGASSVYGMRSQKNISNTGECYGLHVSDNQSTSGRAYGIFAQRQGKPANSDGVLMRLRDGSLGFGVPQVVDAGNPTIFNDGGNLVVIDGTAPIGILVTSPPNGFEDGLFFILTRITPTAYAIGSTNPIDGFNLGGPGSTYTWALGGAYDMLIMFYASSNWFIKGF